MLEEVLQQPLNSPFFDLFSEYIPLTGSSLPTSMSTPAKYSTDVHETLQNPRIVGFEECDCGDRECERFEKNPVANHGIFYGKKLVADGSRAMFKRSGDANSSFCLFTTGSLFLLG